MPAACSVFKIVPFDALALLAFGVHWLLFALAEASLLLVGVVIIFSVVDTILYIAVIFSAIWIIDCCAILSACFLLFFIFLDALGVANTSWQTSQPRNFLPFLSRILHI